MTDTRDAESNDRLHAALKRTGSKQRSFHPHHKLSSESLTRTPTFGINDCSHFEERWPNQFVIIIAIACKRKNDTHALSNLVRKNNGWSNGQRIKFDGKQRYVSTCEAFLIISHLVHSRIRLFVDLLVLLKWVRRGFITLVFLGTFSFVIQSRGSALMSHLDA